MSWINRYIARIGSALGILAFAALLPASAAAQTTDYVFQNKPVVFSHINSEDGRLAIGLDDPGLKSLLLRLGASVTWQPSERYILLTTPAPLVISFAVGDTRYDVGSVVEEASFAPYVENGVAFVPLGELLRALGLEVKHDGPSVVLQPQLASIEVRSSGATTKLVARGAIPLRFRTLSRTSRQITVEFQGVGTTLERSRKLPSDQIREIDLRADGSVRDPRTVATIDLAPDAKNVTLGSSNRRDFVLSVGGSKMTALEPTPNPVASPEDAPATAAPQQAAVSAVNLQSGSSGDTVAVSVDGDATYEWHRFRAPDDRWYVDIIGARLQMAPRDDSGNGPVRSIRVHQVNPTTVRVAMTFAGQNDAMVTPTASGLSIAVSQALAQDDASRRGSGSIGSSAVADATPTPSDGSWKFTPTPSATYAAQNPRLIVIDPGHGGTDPGTVRGGSSEKALALDMSRRLRDVLVARGWQVIMTHETDRDVYGPNASDRAELQARDDVANNAGARMFVSVHVNGFMNSGPHGTTSYYSKSSDIPLAQAVQRRLSESLGTSDDGIVKSKLYVTLHALMPAVLVETAFISNPDDLAKLTSPAWREKVARAIADGIADYAGSPRSAEQSSGQ
ncbi:MAG: N-acetylmuramoyl-L-alanine amidase family protein [Candidatus Eremiobacteraeota bacterium]|nr:N-acetylmuramoyl-L-alanine amidase family protein [Candidatus Eremiobacteraeota bacterium]